MSRSGCHSPFETLLKNFVKWWPAQRPHKLQVSEAVVRSIPGWPLKGLLERIVTRPSAVANGGRGLGLRSLTCFPAALAGLERSRLDF
mmetsp:Transcript_40442/g.106743  ORF Transcript_40442/g.106743 Transcript_40442/m.106743 type:complete len:88 (-) Transcript_40442:164-427(-)